jgi:hypothetical protein
LAAASFRFVVIVIRRLVDRRRAYTGIFLRGEPPKIFPTTDQEHARVLQIFKQDRPYENVENDFSAYALGRDFLPPTFDPPPSQPESVGASQAPAVRKIEPVAHRPRRGKAKASLWLVARETR